MFLTIIHRLITSKSFFYMEYQILGCGYNWRGSETFLTIIYLGVGKIEPIYILMSCFQIFFHILKRNLRKRKIDNVDLTEKTLDDFNI